MSQLVGQQWESYRLTTLLNRGSFAEVYLGEHVRLEMQAAIKIMHAHLTEQGTNLFIQEAQAIADLLHPHIIRLLDFDIKAQRPFLVLDYAPNGSLLQQHEAGQQVPLEQVVIYVKQVAAALQFAHERRLIHRYVKPANMLLSRRNEVLLSDFGVVALTHHTSSMKTDPVVGSLAYMAPEQIQGHPRPASDQYALAVMVYQWLCGKLPFRGSPTEVLAQHLAVTPRPLQTSVPGLPDEVDAVLLKALAKEPQQRFHTVQSFADALERATRRGFLQPPDDATETR